MKTRRFPIFVWLFWPLFGIISMGFAAQAADKPGSVYNAKGKRDPFVPLVGVSPKSSAGGLLSVESTEEIVVEGIVFAPNHKDSLVIANGTVLKEGDEQGSVKVMKIEPEGATFSVNGVEAYKTLYQKEKR